mmetsp:Transcript_30853/g.102063  ORF Transcript_30853/g.102063 Transcript_30853/m.102063 type:complete len:214 (-) Transcript_30853:181-822(-)
MLDTHPRTLASPPDDTSSAVSDTARPASAALVGSRTPQPRPRVSMSQARLPPLRLRARDAVGVGAAARVRAALRQRASAHLAARRLPPRGRAAERRRPRPAPPPVCEVPFRARLAAWRGQALGARPPLAHARRVQPCDAQAPPVGVILTNWLSCRARPGGRGWRPTGTAEGEALQRPDRERSPAASPAQHSAAHAADPKRKSALQVLPDHPRP